MDILNLVAGEPCDNVKPVPARLHRVPCPACLKPMLLTSPQMVQIYIHNYIDCSHNDLEVLCYDCFENDENYE